MVVIGCKGLFLEHIRCVPVYTMCMQKLFTYICDCIRIFECEAHFDVIIVPASVWGYKVIESSTCFTVWGIFMVRDEIWSFREGTGM